jgi:hypothetical protein
MTTAQLFLGIIFGSVGLGYAVYGRKQRAVVALLSGIVLMVLPYFIANVIALVLVGAGLCVLPFIYKP